MGFVKLFLSILLALCFMWGAAIVFGPFLISAVAKKVFDEKVQLSTIRVTPKLGVEIGQLDFDISAPQSSTSYAGNIRALTLNLRQKNLRPSVHLDIGTVNIEEMIFLQNISSVIDFNSTWDLRKGEIKVNIKKSSSNQFFSAEDIFADMTFSDTFSKVGPVQVELRKPTLDQFFLSSRIIKLHLDEYDVFETFSSQSSNLAYQIVEPEYLGTYFSAQEVSGNLEISQNKVTLQSEFVLINEPTLNFSVERATLEADFTSDFGQLISPINISASNGRFLGTDYVAQSLSAYVNILREEIEVNGNLSLNGFEYSNKFGYIGNFPKSTNKYNLVLEERDAERVLQLSLASVFDSYPSIELESTAQASIENKEVIIDCFRVPCSLSDISISYEVELNGSNLNGNISCFQLPCSGPDDIHQLATQNTAEFFNSLITTRVFNPFVLAFLQSKFLEGQLVGSGHKLNLD